MKKLVLASLVLLAASSAFAADKPKSAQQQKMVDCNKQASEKSLKGTERSDFMKHCLSGGATTASVSPQQQKMVTCNKEAGSLKGAERQKFMSDCLKKK
jgi:hypothetical protein